MATTQVPTPAHLTLNTGAYMPMLGLGTWQSTDEQAREAVKTALKVGYRHIDTAAVYLNEESIGQGIRESGVPRSQVFVTDKLMNTWHSRAEEALLQSLQKLDVGYLDLWLMHWPAPLNPLGNDFKFPTKPDGTPDYEEGWDMFKTWKSMEDLHRKYPDKVRAIGVSNFPISLLQRLLAVATVVPAVNQVELHPQLPQDRLVEYCASKGICLLAYSPLGSPSSSIMQDPELQRIADRNNAMAAQVLISWGIKRGYGVLPKSSNPARIKSNAKFIDLGYADMEKIHGLAKGKWKRYCTPGWSPGLFDNPGDI